MITKKEIPISFSIGVLIRIIISFVMSFSLVFLLESTIEINCSMIYPKTKPSYKISSFNANNIQSHHAEIKTFFGNTVKSDRDFYLKTITISSGDFRTYKGGYPTNYNELEFELFDSEILKIIRENNPDDIVYANFNGLNANSNLVSYEKFVNPLPYPVCINGDWTKENITIYYRACLKDFWCIILIGLTSFLLMQLLSKYRFKINLKK